MIELLTLAALPILARMSGGGLGAKHLPKALPEILFGGVFGTFYYAFFGIYPAIAVTLWCYLWMETGHGTVLQWGDDPFQATGKRKQTLTPVVNYLSKKLGFAIGGKNYCRLFMAVKGFLIGLPFGGIPLAILWPLAYEIGNRAKKNELAEVLSGFFAALVIVGVSWLMKK